MRTHHTIGMYDTVYHVSLLAISEGIFISNFTIRQQREESMTSSPSSESRPSTIAFVAPLFRSYVRRYRMSSALRGASTVCGRARYYVWYGDMEDDAGQPQARGPTMIQQMGKQYIRKVLMKLRHSSA